MPATGVAKSRAGLPTQQSVRERRATIIGQRAQTRIQRCGHSSGAVVAGKTGRAVQFADDVEAARGENAAHIGISGGRVVGHDRTRQVALPIIAQINAATIGRAVGRNRGELRA